MYSIKSKHIWFNPHNGRVYSSNPKIEGVIHFASLAEYSLYCDLRIVCDPLGVQILKDKVVMLKGKKWLVDFKLIFKTTHEVEALIYRLENRIVTLKLPVLCIEYKGVITKKEVQRSRELLTMPDNNVIFVSCNKLSGLIGKRVITQTKLIEELQNA